MSVAEEQITTRLKAFPAVAALVGDRVYPQGATLNSLMPYVAYQTQSATRPMNLGRPSALSQITVEVIAYAETEATAQALGDAVVAALHGWQSLPEVVLSTHTPSGQADLDDDEIRSISNTFALWIR